MSIKSEKVLVIYKDYKEEKFPDILKDVQNLECNIYFVDDVVSIKEIRKDIPTIGRISDIRDRTIIIDCSKNFSSKEVEIERTNIESIKMWECPENVLVRRHVKSK